MSAPKLINVHAILGKVEASYGAGGVLAPATDQILSETRVEARRQYIHDGAHEPEIGRGFAYPDSPPSGAFMEFAIPVVARGLGSAYSGILFPPDIHTLLRISGHAATFATTKWEYAPVVPLPANFASGVFEVYDRAQKWPVTGAYATMEFTIEGPGFLRFLFNVFGIAGEPDDAAVPAITYNTVLHPKAVNMALSIGGFTAGKVKRVRFVQNRDLTSRADDNSAGGHGGYSGGGVMPDLEIDVEATALAPTSAPTATTLNPYKMHQEKTQVAIDFSVGAAGVNNRWEFTAPNAMLREEPQEPAEGVSAIWTLPFKLTPSAIGLADAYKLTAAA